jgi:hypothetical protein
VLSKKEHALAIVDPATLKIVAKVPVGVIRMKLLLLQTGERHGFRTTVPVL